MEESSSGTVDAFVVEEEEVLDSCVLLQSVQVLLPPTQLVDPSPPLVFDAAH